MDASVAITGVSGTATVGDEGSIAIAGTGGSAQSGTEGIAISYGYDTPKKPYEPLAIARAYNGGVAIVRSYGVAAVSGIPGIAIAEGLATDRTEPVGTAQAHQAGSIAMALNSGTVSGVTGAILVIRYIDPGTKQYKLVTGIVGEDGLKPNIEYAADGKGGFNMIGPAIKLKKAK